PPCPASLPVLPTHLWSSGSMSYEVVARRWRPLTFGSVVGQGHVTQTLANAIVRDRVPHAFLLTGTRGVGKTTIARLLARAINCTDRGENAEPCNKCPSCLQNLDRKSTRLNSSHSQISYA